MPKPASAAPLSPQAPWRIWLAIAGLAVATWVVYANSLRTPFIFDDIPSIADNPTIKDLRRTSDVLAPSALNGAGVVGRPVVNLSLALNHAIGGSEVFGYHVFNLIVHLAAGLALFGVVRRSLARMPSAAIPATPFAFVVALLWLVHPLQTETVTCVIQRTEGLAGLFVFLTFYSFIRSLDGGGAVRLWQAACLGAALLGAATKELVVTVPVLLLLYDRVFVAGTFRAAWASRRGLYLALLSTWVLVAVLVWQSEVRGGAVGFGHGVTAWDYALTQCRALTMYFKLALWPHPLVLDYGTEVIREARQVVLEGVVVLALLGVTIWALVRRPVLGFLGAWCFIILSPSSSFVPLVTQTMAEHRMYLPLAGIVILAGLALHRWLGRAFVAVGVALAIGLGIATVARNHDYRSAEAIWRDTIAKRPGNPRAYYTLAQLADKAGNSAEAIAFGEGAVRLLPDDAMAHFNLAFSMTKAKQFEAAATHYEHAVRLKPDYIDAQINLGNVLVWLGRLEPAIGVYEKVVRAQPDRAVAWFNLGQVYFYAGRLADAVAPLETSLRLEPNQPAALLRLGNTRLQLGQLDAAVVAYRETLRLDPNQFEAMVNLAGALLSLGRAREAVPLYERAVQLQPSYPGLQAGLARARAEAR